MNDFIRYALIYGLIAVLTTALAFFAVYTTPPTPDAAPHPVQAPPPPGPAAP